MIREYARLVVQLLSFSLRSRRPALWLLVVVGSVAVLIAMGLSFVAPVLIYPVL